MSWLTFVALSFTAYRVGRFISLDSLIDAPRNKAAFWLADREEAWSELLLELLRCPYCITIWTGLGATVFWSLALASWPGWWFPVYWMAISTGAVVTWGITDPD
jgi:hypothetical protein